MNLIKRAQFTHLYVLIIQIAAYAVRFIINFPTIFSNTHSRDRSTENFFSLTFIVARGAAYETAWNAYARYIGFCLYIQRTGSFSLAEPPTQTGVFQRKGHQKFTFNSRRMHLNAICIFPREVHLSLANRCSRIPNKISDRRSHILLQ